VEIVFEFDRVRNFSAIHLHANNLFTKDVQVRTLLISFSCTLQ
jgi:discoidin domain receptor family member 2